MRIGERMQEKRQLEYGNWWKPIFIDDADFPCFHLALRLIALIHVLSCAVEKVFSQLEKLMCVEMYTKMILKLKCFLDVMVTQI